MLVAVDVGNSSLKCGAFDGGRLVATERVEGGLGLGCGAGSSGGGGSGVGGPVDDVLPFPFLATADEVAVIASAPGRLEGFLRVAGRRVRVLGEDVQRAVRSSYTDPLQLGTDRIAAAYGAHALVSGPAVVVDAGTATTVDGIDTDRRVSAVAIAPGLGSSAVGLKARASHLPWPSTHRKAVRVPAETTADSLANGFVLGLAGLVERLVEEPLGRVSGAVLVLTGGFAPALSPWIRTPHRVEPHAVLYGIRVLHEEFSR